MSEETNDFWGFDDDDLPSREFEQITEGIYGAVIEDASLDMTEDPAKVQFVYKITHSKNGKFKNRKIWSNFSMADDRRKWLKIALSKMKFDTNKIKSVEAVGEIMPELLGKQVELFVKNNQKGDKVYTNAYINGLINMAEFANVKEDPAQAAPQFNDSDDLGF